MAGTTYGKFYLIYFTITFIARDLLLDNLVDSN